MAVTHQLSVDAPAARAHAIMRLHRYRAWPTVLLPVAVLTAAALALRLYGIGHQGLWFDEAYTVMLVKLPFGQLLSTVPRTESTPYLYYVLVWVWTHIFGRGAADLRAFSALCGTAVVPLAYLGALKLFRSRRAGVIAAALTAFNPLLVWYSQEARAYELLVLTGACSVVAFIYLLDHVSARRLGCWAVASGLALATHYDAALVVAPEALWLLWRYRRTLGAWLAVAFVVACGGGLLPLLLAQEHTRHADWINHAPLNERLGQILPQFLLGTGSHAYTALMGVGFASAALALGLLAWFGSHAERRRGLGLGALALAGFAVALVALAAGSDTILTRNLLALWLPAALLVAGACAARRSRRLGAATAVVLCAIGLTAAISVATDTTLQRPDWPALVHALGPWPSRPASRQANRLLVFQANPWLESLTHVYMSDVHKLNRRHHFTAARVSEVDVVANSAPQAARKHWLCWWGAACNLYPSALAHDYRLSGFHALGVVRVRQFSILRLVASSPRHLTSAELHRALGSSHLRSDGLLLQHPATR